MVGKSAHHFESSVIRSQHQGRYPCLVARIYISTAGQEIYELANLAGLSDFP